MFTGIIQTIGEVVDIDKERGDPRFFIKTDINLEGVPIGASISHSGCCLTVVEKEGKVFATDVSAETLSKTNLVGWAKGTRINLETSLKMGDEMGGHIVTGHVDGLAEITTITPEGESHRLTIKPPHDLMRYIAPKGCVALDGISLTVNEVSENSFGVNIIPHTWDVTTLRGKQVGDRLNIEIDTIARYAIRSIEAVMDRN
jgi:riboflavin synthase